MSKEEIRFYMGGNLNNLFESIDTCRSSFMRIAGESPNKITMNYKIFERLKILANANNIKLGRGNNTPATVFGMRIRINNDLEDNEILLKKEENMNEVMSNCMRYAMGGYGFYPRGTFKELNRLPKKYIINKGATVLFWEDGSKTVVKRGKDDEYNKVLGFLWAYFQKTSGLSRTKANKYLADLVDEEPMDKEDNSIRKHKIGDVVTIRGCGNKRTITDYYDNGDSHGYFLDNGCIAWYDSEFED